MTKYFYDGMTLVQYCFCKDYNIKTIMNRIQGKYRTVEEAIKTYEDYDAKGKKFPHPMIWILSDGRGLRQACLKENVNYNNALKKIKQGQSVDEAFLNTKKNISGKIKYFYKGKPFIEFCKENHIIYNDFFRYFRKKRNQYFNFKQKSFEDLVDTYLKERKRK